jgi:hypothetical protein
MGFRPRDAIEALLAGHCVMFHEVMVDSVHDTLRGELDTMRRGTRSNLVALNKAFNGNLDRLERYQLRPSEGSREAAEAQAADARSAPPEVPARDPGNLTEAEPDPMQAAATGAAPAQSAVAQSEAAVPADETTVMFQASPEAIAACRANPEAMAALDAGDPERFARAMGIEPSAEYLAAAGLGSVFDRHASAGKTPPFPAARSKR